MNFDFYLFGNPCNKYDHIPNDYIASKIAAFLKDLKSSRLVIVRQMDLMHYIYVEKLDKTKFIGFCLIFNKVYSSHPKQLVSLFRDLIEDYLVKKGDVLRYSKEGELQYVVQSFSDNELRYQKLRTLIKEKFENASAQYGIRELTSIFNGEHSTRVAEFNIDETQITAMSLAYNTLIVDDTEGLQQGYIPQVITELNNKIQRLSEQNSELKTKNDTLKRQKKQTTFVLILLCIIIVGGLMVYNYATDKEQTIRLQSNTIDELTTHVNQLTTDSTRLEENLLSVKTSLASTQIELKQKNKELDEKVSMIESLQENVNKLETKLGDVKTKLEATKKQLDLYKKNITNTPFIITEVSVANTYYDRRVETNYGGYLNSSTSMYIMPKISYFGLISGSKTIYIKLFKPNGEMVILSDNKSPKGYTDSYSMNISKGENNMELNGLGGNKGFWSAGKYKYEFYCDGKLIGLHEFTIH